MERTGRSITEPTGEGPHEATGGRNPARLPSPGESGGTRPRSSRGFTLIELMVVVSIIGILVSIAVPTYRNIVERARETVLKQNLAVLRDVIDQYYADKGKYPEGLESLVSEGYLRHMPVDPMTGKSDWATVPYTGNDPGQLQPTEGQESGGIFDVHSASDQLALDGTKFSEW